MYSNSSSGLQDSSGGRSTAARVGDGESSQHQQQRPTLGQPTATTTGIGRTSSQRKAGGGGGGDVASKIDGIIQVSGVAISAQDSEVIDTAKCTRANTSDQRNHQGHLGAMNQY